ncbi:hypothetical protein VTJ04DRAFT_1252 [Mycothermus thermophilus]|uniref:uncharacterized protein n=1 Tax=Humicola insolens TaxID=85995 RepID=UPI003744079E
MGAQGHVMALAAERRVSVPESAVLTGPSCLPSRRSTKRPSVSDQGQNGEEHGSAKKARGSQVTPETITRTTALSIKTQPGAETSEGVVITKLQDGASSGSTLDCGQEATYTNDALTASPKPSLSHVKQKNESREQNHQPPTATLLKPVLRTATRRRSQNQPPASSLPKPGETPARQRARTNHNRVEQQYRHRLQARFESLCRVLPLTDAEHDEAADDDNSVAEDEDEDDPEDVADVAREPRKRRGHGQKDNHNQQQRRMSKEAVLLLAEQTIQELQHKVERLEKEKEVLLKTMGQMSDPGSALSAG